jgi:hypothetical protein
MPATRLDFTYRTAGSGRSVSPSDERPGDPERGEPDDDRDETPMERLDRNTVELLNELRVAAVGIQVLFAFLLIVPFNSGFKKVDTFDRWDYFITLLCIATAAVLLISPSIHHRILFRRRQKAYLVTLGTQLTIAAAGFLTVGLTGIMVLISHVIFGALAAIIVGACVAVVVSALWFAIPLARRRKLRAHDR